MLSLAGSTWAFPETRVVLCQACTQDHCVCGAHPQRYAAQSAAPHPGAQELSQVSLDYQGNDHSLLLGQQGRNADTCAKSVPGIEVHSSRTQVSLAVSIGDLEPPSRRPLGYQALELGREGRRQERTVHVYFGKTDIHLKRNTSSSC